MSRTFGHRREPVYWEKAPLKRDASHKFRAEWREERSRIEKDDSFGYNSRYVPARYSRLWVYRAH